MTAQTDKINKIDIVVLKSFFEEYNGSIRRIIEEWRATNWINEHIDLGEYANRTRIRLEKLERLGLIQKKEKQSGKGDRKSWYPTKVGLYFMLTTLKNTQEVKDFIIANREIGNFETLRKYFQKHGMQRIKILIKDISGCAKNLKYKQIDNNIKAFFEEIQTKTLDWSLEIIPNGRTKVFNHDTGEYEIY